MSLKHRNQFEFSELLFDTLFGLVLFFSIDSFLDIVNPIHFIFYISSLIIVIHWWLGVKSADDIFGEEVSHSSLDLILGIIYIIFLEYIVLMSKTFNYSKATLFIILLFGVELIWAIIW